MKIEIPTLESLPLAAANFLASMKGNKVFAFDGQMGAGKTTFISALLNEMGVKQPNGSPTYSIVNEYETVEYGKINHFDLYRLNSEMEAFDIGIEEKLYGDEYCFLEWPGKIESLLPSNTIWVYLRVEDEDVRILDVILNHNKKDTIN